MCRNAHFLFKKLLQLLHVSCNCMPRNAPQAIESFRGDHASISRSATTAKWIWRAWLDLTWANQLLFEAVVQGTSKRAAANWRTHSFNNWSLTTSVYTPHRHAYHIITSIGSIHICSVRATKCVKGSSLAACSTAPARQAGFKLNLLLKAKPHIHESPRNGNTVA